MTVKAINTLRIGDTHDWDFVNGAWRDGEDGRLELSEEACASDRSAHYYAFHRHYSYKDVSVRFEFLLKPHSDAGIILRAGDESHFYLLHFPNCGQACRAQHFWAAFSRMDETGYLKHIKLEMVRRVPSNAGIWLSAELILKDNRISVRIGDNGFFTAEDDTYADAGRIGVLSAGDAQIRNVVIEGQESPSRWTDDAGQPDIGFHPCPDTEHGSAQQPIDLMRLPSGELLLSFKAGDVIGQGTIYSIRSTDGGRSWSKPEPLNIPLQGSGWSHARLHATPAGRLICLVPTETGFVTAESADEGRSWSELVPLDIGQAPPNVKKLGVGPQAFLNLADGSMLALMCGGYNLSDPDLTVGNWGSLHCQGFSMRSVDDGRTWSEPVNLDNSAGLGVKGQCDGLDLCEICAAQMGDGRIMALIRPIFSAWMWETWSADGGVTWGPCVRGPFPGYATPNMLRTASGKVLVAHRLPSMTVHCSQNDGQTWDEGTQIDTDVWTMGVMIETQPDVVLYVYFTESLMRAQLMRITPDGLRPVGME